VESNLQRTEAIYRSTEVQCRDCLRKAECTSGRYKQLVVHVDEEVRQRARERNQKPDYFRHQRSRKKIEALFGELKNRICLRRTRLRRLRHVREQFLMAATAQNLKRLVRFLATTPPAKNKLRNQVRVEISLHHRAVRNRNRTSRRTEFFNSYKISGHLMAHSTPVNRGSPYAYTSPRGRYQVGHKTLSADEPTGRGPGHRLSRFASGPMGANSKQPKPNNLPKFYAKSKVRKKMDTTLHDRTEQMQTCVSPDVDGNAARELYMDRATAVRLRCNCGNGTGCFRLDHHNRQQLRGRLRTATKSFLAILVAPLEYLVRVHAVLACYTGNRCPGCKRRFDNTTLLVHTAMDALRRFRLGSTFDNFVHSVIVASETALYRRPSDDAYHPWLLLLLVFINIFQVH